MRHDPEARACLAVETGVLRTLAGRGAPRLLASGEDGEGPWLVMEHSALPPLGRLMERWKSDLTADPAAFVTELAPHIFDALAQIHEADDERGPLGIVHGDVSPQNLLVAEDAARALFIDFALARSREAPDTSSGAFRGSPLYAAPEVARGDRATPSSDIFSAALTLLHAAQARAAAPPRRNKSLAALIAEAGSESVVLFATVAAARLPPRLAALLLQCVEARPEDRPTHAREAAERAA